MKAKGRILVVDDNYELCDGLTDILKLNGYNVRIAHDGEQAVEIVKNDKFDLALMDIKLPGVNGIDASKILKNIAPYMPFIFITAFSDDALYGNTISKNGLEVFQKPFDIDKLLKRINELCPPAGNNDAEK